MKFLFWPQKRIDSLKNPYIDAHKKKMKNDMMYEDYIKWLDKNGHGVPIPKTKSPEDIQAEKNIKSQLGI